MSTPRRKRTRVHTHKVARALIIKGDKVLLAQRAAGGKQALTWETPGGGIHPKRKGRHGRPDTPAETPEQAAIRETFEEIGVHINIKAQLVEHLYRVHRTFQIKTTLFLAELADPDEPFVLDPDEVEQVGWFDFDNLPDNLNATTLEVVLAAFKKP